MFSVLIVCWFVYYKFQLINCTFTRVIEKIKKVNSGWYKGRETIASCDSCNKCILYPYPFIFHHLYQERIVTDCKEKIRGVLIPLRKKSKMFFKFTFLWFFYSFLFVYCLYMQIFLTIFLKTEHYNVFCLFELWKFDLFIN